MMLKTKEEAVSKTVSSKDLSYEEEGCRHCVPAVNGNVLFIGMKIHVWRESIVTYEKCSLIVFHEERLLNECSKVKRSVSCIIEGSSTVIS